MGINELRVGNYVNYNGLNLEVYSFNRKSLKDMNVYMPLYIYLNPNCAKIADFTVKQNVEYVHQLQNLFFAINGKELNINL